MIQAASEVYGASSTATRVAPRRCDHGGCASSPRGEFELEEAFSLSTHRNAIFRVIIAMLVMATISTRTQLPADRPGDPRLDLRRTSVGLARHVQHRNVLFQAAATAGPSPWNSPARRLCARVPTSAPATDSSTVLGGPCSTRSPMKPEHVDHGRFSSTSDSVQSAPRSVGDQWTTFAHTRPDRPRRSDVPRLPVLVPIDVEVIEEADVLRLETELRVDVDSQPDLFVRAPLRSPARRAKRIVEGGGGIQRRGRDLARAVTSHLAVDGLIRYSRADVKFDDKTKLAADGQGGWRRSDRRHPVSDSDRVRSDAKARPRFWAPLPISPQTETANTPASSSGSTRSRGDTGTRRQSSSMVPFMVRDSRPNTAPAPPPGRVTSRLRHRRDRAGMV